MANFQKDLAVILMAAGYGTRLMPLTKILPKCLMPISEYPLIQYWIDYILALNIDKVALNTHYHHNKVLNFLDNNNYNSKVKVFHEPKLLGTAGTLRSIYNWSNRKTILLVHADNWIGADLKEFINFHFNYRNSSTVMSMMTFTSDKPHTCGVVEIDENNIVQSFYEKVDNPPTNLANGAVYIIECEVMDYINENKLLNDFSCDIIPAFLGRISTWYNKSFHRDIGTFHELTKAQTDESSWKKYLKNNNNEWKKKYLEEREKILDFLELDAKK